MNKTCIIIAGPTASGKTSVALDLATHFNTSIISADSRQCYREMNIGVAKPSPQELARVPHYFIDTHSVHEEVTAASFEQYALEQSRQVFEKNNVVIMAGGTGLYLKAFCEGLDQIPPTDPVHKTWINEGFDKGGLPWLKEQLITNDPIFSAEGEMQNPRRMMRALEVVLSTGTSIIEFQKKTKLKRPFDIMKFGLSWPRSTLYNRIDIRVDQMIQQGLEAEARALYAERNLKALQTVGYQEMFRFFDGNITLPQAINLIKQNTRRYAKRQMTWFNKDEELTWLDGSDPSNAVSEILRNYAHQ